MSEVGKVHPREIELARMGDGEADAGVRRSAAVMEHLHWCARCRSVVADYVWLQGEIAATLVTAADAVPVPRSKWWVVQDALFTSQRRQITGWRVSAAASVVLAVCLMLVTSPVLGTAVVARTLPPEVMVAPAPVTDVVPGELVVSVATSTPVVSCEGAIPLPAPTPAFMLPPTPPEPEA